MTRRVAITIAVLAAFAVTTAVPGPQVVAHRHAGGDHEHVHAFLTGDDGHGRHPDRDHGDPPRDRDHEHRHPHEHGHAHAHRHPGDHAPPGLARGHHDPLAHAHVTSPFQPATATAAPVVVAVARTAADVPRPAGGPRLRPRTPGRSRGPPSPLLA